MKSVLTIIICLLTFQTQAQQVVETPTPNTETAFLNYDYSFQKSGYEQVEAKMIYSYLNQPLRLYFVVDSAFDYMFVAICDSAAGGLKVECYFEQDTAPFVQNDMESLIRDFNSKISLVPLHSNERSGNISILLNLQGKVNPVEPSYYIMVRKKKLY